MKALLSVWNLLSIPSLLVAMLLGWWGWKHWPAASAQSRPVTLADLDRQESGLAWIRDSFDFDITSPGLRQENNYGFKGPALAVFPVFAPALQADTAPAAPARHGVVSSDPRFVGPAIATFLRPDSMAVLDIKVSTTTSQHVGNIGPEMQALVQITAEKLGHAPLDLPKKGRAWIEGLAVRRAASEVPDLANPAETVWEIRMGEQPDTASVVLAFLGSIALAAAFFGMNLVAKNVHRAELEREIAEREEEKGLV